MKTLMDPNSGKITDVNNIAVCISWLRLQHAESKQDTGWMIIWTTYLTQTSLIDTPVTAIMGSIFSAPTNSPLRHRILPVFKYKQPPILTPATTQAPPTKSFQLCFRCCGLDYRLKVIREESNTANQQFLDSIDEGMKKVIKEQVKKEVSKITLKIEKLVIDQLESEVLVRSSKEANTLMLTGGPKEEGPASTSAPSETTTTTAGKTTTTGSKTHKQSASQSAPVEETMQTTNVFEALAHQEFEKGVHDEQAEEEVQHLPDWFQQPTRLTSPDHAWNKSVPAIHESVQPFNTTAGNPVKKILLKLNLSDHRSILMDLKCRCIKVKEFQERCNIKAFQASNQEWYSNVGPEFASPQEGKDTRMAKSLCLVDDLKLLKITMSNTSSRNKLNPEVNDHYNIFSRESQEYELKTKDEA
ncbi:hypothetical protein Tco_1143912 [Tanacetum coccineum]